jgi:hypothetical protein
MTNDQGLLHMITIEHTKFRPATARVQRGLGGMFVVAMTAAPTGDAVAIDFFYRQAEAERLVKDLNGIADGNAAVVEGGRARTAAGGAAVPAVAAAAQ